MPAPRRRTLGGRHCQFEGSFEAGQGVAYLLGAIVSVDGGFVSLVGV